MPYITGASERETTKLEDEPNVCIVAHALYYGQNGGRYPAASHTRYIATHFTSLRRGFLLSFA